MLVGWEGVECEQLMQYTKEGGVCGGEAILGSDSVVVRLWVYSQSSDCRSAADVGESVNQWCVGV